MTLRFCFDCKLYKISTEFSGAGLVRANKRMSCRSCVARIRKSRRAFRRRVA